MKRTVALTATTVTLAASAGVFAVTGPFAQASSHAGHATPSASSAGTTNTHFLIVEVNDTHQYAILHGAVNAYGKDTSPKDAYDVAHLNGGTLRVTHPDKDETFTPHINQTTCFVSFTVKGTLTVGHGTGKYAGVTGTGSYVGHGQAFLKKKSSGGCKMHGQAASSDIDYINGSMSLTK